MNPLNQNLIEQYKKQDQEKLFTRDFNWKLNWIGAWRLMYDWSKL